MSETVFTLILVFCVVGILYIGIRNTARKASDSTREIALQVAIVVGVALVISGIVLTFLLTLPNREETSSTEEADQTTDTTSSSSHINSQLATDTTNNPNHHPTA